MIPNKRHKPRQRQYQEEPIVGGARFRTRLAMPKREASQLPLALPVSPVLSGEKQAAGDR